MAARFELVALAVPSTLAPDALPSAVANLITGCWPGMSRAQLLDRARRLSLRVTLHPLTDRTPDGLGRFALTLTSTASVSIEAEVFELIAHVRRLARRRPGARRAKVSLPPARDARQMGLF